MIESKTIAVLFGGASSEHDVSCVSAASVIRNLSSEKYKLLLVGITKDGRWLLYHGPIEDLANGKWEQHPGNLPAVISPDPSHQGLTVFHGPLCEQVPVDAVFPVLHGKNGEDGTIQGLLQMAGLPFVGCSAAASAVCMDKVYTNMVLDAAGIPQAKWVWCTAGELRANPDAVLGRIEAALPYPVFVKPANAGSSVGVGKAKNREEALACLTAAAAHDSRLLIEEGIDGAEVECAVLGNQSPIASVVGEIVPVNEFYDYEAKYVAESELHIPARIPEETAEAVRRTAVKAYQALGCEGLARVDFFVRHSDGAVLLNEPNTIPGFTSISMYPKLFEAAGVPYPELLDRLIGLAWERAGK